MSVLVWFRSDLRVLDNPALAAARSHGQPVRALYLAMPEHWRLSGFSGKRADFTSRHLAELRRALARMDIALDILHVDTLDEAAEVIGGYVRDFSIGRVFANFEPGDAEHDRDNRVAEQVSLTRFYGDCVLPPTAMQRPDGTPFTRFGSYFAHWLEQLRQHKWQYLPCDMDGRVSKERVSLHYPLQDSSEWQVGEQGAREVLNQFLLTELETYGTRPAKLLGGSRLSAYLNLGVLSPRQAAMAVIRHAGHRSFTPGTGAIAWLQSLCRRDYCHHLMYAFPLLSRQHAFQEREATWNWSQDQQVFDYWKQGMTGYPLIDAAMRQLNQQGWMPHALRRQCASFLCKQLLIDWRWGERYFMKTLIDADQAQNSFNWQDVAAVGCHAGPFFTIDNPITQAQELDPDASYISRFIPALDDLPVESRFWPDRQQRKACHYIEPLVDPLSARANALKWYRQQTRSLAAD